MEDIAVLLALIAIVVAAFTVLPILVSAAQLVEARVNAPEYVAGTFNATIDVANVTDLNSGQFDLSFNSSVVNGSGYLTEIEFGVKGNSGEKSTLNISNEMLVDTKAKKIDAEEHETIVLQRVLEK
ncbi:MAG: hypothetical protein WBE22_11385 [Halobacteriota archaeon]